MQVRRAGIAGGAAGEHRAEDAGPGRDPPRQAREEVRIAGKPALAVEERGIAGEDEIVLGQAGRRRGLTAGSSAAPVPAMPCMPSPRPRRLR